MRIATLIAAGRLARGDISAACDALSDLKLAPGSPEWIEPGSACDLRFEGDPRAARLALEGKLDGIDVVVQPAEGRVRRLLAADMDSTIIDVECIDELADFAGARAEVAAVTDRAMRGEIPFEAALDERVALLEGLEERVIDRCLEERVSLTAGARTLVRTMKANGAWCLLVSGGFTRFADPIAAEVGFDAVSANRLEIVGGRLTGRVEKPVVGAVAKRDAMLASGAAHGVPSEAMLAVGDGANDLLMLEAAGLGIAYRAKPAVAAAADARIEANDLSALLYVQGYARNDWVD